MIAPSDMSPYDFALTDPELEAVTIDLDPSITAKPWRVARSRLTTALRTSLQEPVLGWRVQRVPYLDGIIYDLLPPDGIQLTSKQAWSLTHALEALPDVFDADPSFVVRQDAVEDREDQSAEAAALAAPAPTAALEVEPCDDDKAPESVDPGFHDWSIRLIDVPCAWQLTPPPPQPGFEQGKIKGEGVRIGHPDSGYRHHIDYFILPNNPPRHVRTDLEKDYVDGTLPALNVDGDHGLSTGSVIMSSNTTGNVNGVAPEAEIVPLRVTRRRAGLPAPILFWSGARALRKAIGYATNEADCHVISISLGWFRNRSLHRAIKDAESKNVIVCAAAGNYTVIVAWPAAYAEVIAVAGCNSQRRKWGPSASGPEVAVSGPAEDVWVPTPSSTQKPDPHQSNGTSFAVATVAGVAALWLAYHGRDFLLDRYRGTATLSQVFRHVLSVSSDPFSTPVGNGFGAGIVNARRVLLTPLPSSTVLQAAPPATPVALATPGLSSPVDDIADAFPDVPENALRIWLAAKLDVAPDELDQRIVGMEDELIFHIATNPALRAELATSGRAAANGSPVAMATPAPGAAPSGPSFSTDQFSDQLQNQVTSNGSAE